MADKKLKHFSVVFIGHVDSGKSTTTGHLVYLSGGIDKRTMEKIEKEAIERGKGSFKFAYILDRAKASREKGVTIDCGTTALRTKSAIISVVDAPGHTDFLKNMITGAAGADLSVVVVPATAGEFEVAISKSTGTLHQHCTLIFALGVKGVCIAINKIDAAGYSQARFEECTKATLGILYRQGYKDKTIPSIPISGLAGDNLLVPSDKMPWYKGWTYTLVTGKTSEVKTGVTMIDWFESRPEPDRFFDKDFRSTVDGSVKINGVGTVVTGKVETGTLKVNDLVHVCPAGITTEVKSIEMHHTALTVANPGDRIGFNLRNVAVTDVRRGHVVGHANNNPPRVCTAFVCQVVVVNSTGPKDKGLKKGVCPIIDCHVAHFQCRVHEVRSKIDKRTGKEIEVATEDSAPIALKCGDGGFVEFHPSSSVCVECYSDFPQLGRIAVRDGKVTTAVGIIKSVTRKEETAAVKGGAAKAAAKAGGAKGKK